MDIHYPYTLTFLDWYRHFKVVWLSLFYGSNIYIYIFFLFSDIEGCIPYNLTSFIKCPTAQCETCKRDIFLSAFPVVFKRYLGYILGMCCSLKCVKKCYQVIDLPLIYPTIEDMSLALALVL